MATRISAPSVDSIKSTFTDAPHISERPLYEELRELELATQRNAYKCKTSNGGGHHGCLGLVLPTAEYSAISGTPWVNDANPGDKATVPTTATAASERDLERIFAAKHYRYHYEQNAEIALKLYIENAVGYKNIQGISNLLSGLDQITIPAIFKHLFGRPSARVTPAEVHQQRQAIDKQAYNVEEEMEELFLRVQEFERFAKHGRDPITNLNMCNMTVGYIHATGHYNKACDDWWAKPDPDHTWDNLKTHFTAAEVIVRRNSTTKTQAGYHTANLIQAMRTEHQVAIDRLQHDLRQDLQVATNEFHQALRTHMQPTGTENVPPNSQQALGTQTTPNATLLQEIEDLKLLVSKQEWQLKLSKGKGGTPRTPFVNKNTNYCWSHGYNIADDHTSATCKRPAQGHHTDASRADTKGGTTRGKRLVGL